MIKYHSSEHLFYSYSQLQNLYFRKTGNPANNMLVAFEGKREDYIFSRKIVTFLHFQFSTHTTQSLFKGSCLMRILVEPRISHISHLKPIVLKKILDLLLEWIYPSPHSEQRYLRCNSASYPEWNRRVYKYDPSKCCCISKLFHYSEDSLGWIVGEVGNLHVFFVVVNRCESFHDNFSIVFVTRESTVFVSNPRIINTTITWRISRFLP